MKPRWIVAAAVIAVLGVAVPPAPAATRRPSTWIPNTDTSWPMSPGGDNFLTGYAPQETPPPFIGCRGTACRKTGDADGPWLEWVTKISDLPTGAFPTAAIVAHDGLLYVGGGATNSFLALDMDTGLPVWRFSPDPRTDGVTAQYPSSNAPSIHNGLIYTTFSNGYMYALDAKTGRKIWSFRATDGYRDTKPSRPGDADHPPRAALDSYTESSQPKNRHKFGSVHPGVDYPKPHGRSAVCTDENVAAFVTLSGWAYGLDATTGKPLWKRYVDAPDFPGEMVWPEYKEGGALNPKNSSLGSSTRRFEAVPGLACGNGELLVLASDGHLRFLEPRTGKLGPYNCGYSRPCESNGGGNVGPEYERLDRDSNDNPVDMCAASGFNCDMAIGLAIPPLAASAAGNGTKGGDYLVSTLDSRLIRLSWDEHRPLWRREYPAPLPFQLGDTMPLVLNHLEHGFITQAVIGGPMALDPDVAGKGARPILYAAAQDGQLYVLSVNELGGGLRGNDPGAPKLLARIGISPNEQVETPYTRRGEGGPWDYNQHALAGLVLGGGVLYVPTWDNRMFAFDVRDPSDPKKVWEHEIVWDKTFKYPPFGKTFDEPLADVDNKIWSSPALLGGRLYFTANDGAVYAFNVRRPVRTVRNLVVLGSGLVPFLPG
ncbi:MAG TPA: PQQ-binding-like beta-propeller repeat protein, partial [Actinomycetota bacterium]|nr:PQQ-binding-like beta-propeller repeat protein [Actinomycetota bacterium]